MTEDKKSVTGIMPITESMSYSVLYSTTSDHAGFFFVIRSQVFKQTAVGRILCNLQECLMQAAV